MTDKTTPTPPDGVPQYLQDGLERQGPETLRMIMSYAEDLANYKEQKQQRELEEDAIKDPNDAPDNWDQDEWDDALDDVDAPLKATLTTKEIDGRLYYYYQWREGDSIKSEYVAPVSPSSN